MSTTNNGGNNDEQKGYNASTPNNANNNTFNANNRNNPMSRFKGNTSEMNGYVFEMGSIQSSQYSNTLDMLRQYIAVTYDSSKSLFSILGNPPTAPSIATPNHEPTATGPLASNGTK
uniref:Uncharacterized protein n=1 Tax=Eucampia antarctica TaxID=49252 RepID=A0A7S2R1Y0_9STRA|mmetsp:Transcript_13926/g.13506  ORF Transcript_13926/g.13506 Transcript_13926/m.13506 type:complete len:117 (+) Transcript_13926:205-555(+)|eukprot:CAMPEP_0197837514 /NCGR_PEP_ID=MMETSP1437-20131217/32375_1 /TAXON_ID=49252 ORGANISM="Eucampia antarctica, Strain CCMP1452" /NCGR_SAMPLE_ID=MMETSP1437 /ASSEMBLY_ACC=CAM_ASM_001096 /LENGTH=116 /DNA_ID=CAMNT_0043444607 /DNA_START=200 /DNA_END=550 /DNA_ORIENTATION=+